MDVRTLHNATRKPYVTQQFGLLAASDGVRCSDVAFNTASDGLGAFSVHAAFDVGSWLSGGTWFLWEGMWAWDTSAIPVGATVARGRLIVTPSVCYVADTNFQLLASAFDWGAPPPTSADWRTSPQLQALPLMGHIDAADMLVAGQPYSMDMDAGFVGGIVKGGTTRAVGSVSSQYNRSQPPVAEQGYDLTTVTLEVTWSLP